MQKVFIGPQLRRLRAEKGGTQAAMAKALGISASYLNLLENNERSVSVPVLLKLFEVYGVDWRQVSDGEDMSRLADLRAIVEDPLFDSERPDLAELRAALVHSPALAAGFLKLYRAYQSATDTILSLPRNDTSDHEAVIRVAPEAAVHDFFRKNRNHFAELEEAAERFWDGQSIAADDMYAAAKTHLSKRLGVTVRIVPVDTLPDTLRLYDAEARELLLSEALDYPNRLFQICHVAALIEAADVLDALLEGSGISDPTAKARCKVELANYYAAAVMMPYAPFRAEAERVHYDFDHLAIRFGVSFEQACHRATTLQRPAATGVPLFFLRIDKAGNVTKRFNATDFHLAEHGGACPRLDVHLTFRTPRRIVTQFVEMPDRSKFFVFARTVSRPRLSRGGDDNGLAVAMGCAVEHAASIGYAENFRIDQTQATPIGINCRICPRANCDQRAHQAAVLPGPIDANRRGATRYGV